MQDTRLGSYGRLHQGSAREDNRNVQIEHRLVLNFKLILKHFRKNFKNNFVCFRSIVPDNFNDLLQVYTANGFRVIAMAGKSLDSSVSWSHACKMPRDVIESDLTFYGFLIMQNAIKPETIPVIEELTKAGLRSVMVTGEIGDAICLDIESPSLILFVIVLLLCPKQETICLLLFAWLESAAWFRRQTR